MHKSRAEKLALSSIISVLGKNVCPQVNPTRKEKFCWGIVATLCKQIQPKQDSFQWAESHANIIEKMGEIYGLYCKMWDFEPESVQCILQKELSPDICRSLPEAKNYYEWIQQIHNIFSNWNDNLLHQTINYYDMLELANSHSSICKVAKAVCAMSIIATDEDILEMKNTYLQNFEELNLLLLRYVPEVPRAKWYVCMF